MKRRIKIIVVLTLLLAGNTFSQEHSISHFAVKALTINESQISGASVFTANRIVNSSTSKPVAGAGLGRLVLPDYYTHNFGFFCQKELQLEKATKIPFRFRLGSLEYCNRLEGKQ